MERNEIIEQIIVFLRINTYGTASGMAHAVGVGYSQVKPLLVLLTLEGTIKAGYHRGRYYYFLNRDNIT